MSEIKEETVVQTVDVNIDELLGMPGAESVLLPGETPPAAKPKRTVFSDLKPDTSFLDKPVETPVKVEKTPAEIEAAKKAEEEAEAARLAQEAIDNEGKTEQQIADEKKIAEEAAAALANEDILAPGANVELTPEQQAELEKNKGGRPTALVTAAKKMIADKILTPFVDKDGKEEPIDNYTAEDFQELITANLNSQKEKLDAEVPEAFFKTLPPEMQQAYTYLANGGTDMKGMFGALSASAEVRDIDITQENGQKAAIRAYLGATQYGTPDEIEDEINSLDDRGDLEKKATQFKPKLDAMQQQIVAKRVADQEASNKQRQEQSQNYIENMFATLETGKLNEMEIDNKTQNMLYAGLVQSNYPSISGKQTNMLGHLLEKYQWVEPNHALIAEALYLLAEPEAYRASLSKGAKTEVVVDTVRTLKTEQQAKSTGTPGPEAVPAATPKRQGVQRPQKNFFKRS